MTVGKQAFDQRSEAGESLHRLIRHNQSDSKEFRTLASYRGFDIKCLVFQQINLFLKPSLLRL